MEQQQEQTPMPKKSCMITLMFPVTEDTEAMELKAIIDEYMGKIPEKRYTFQIVER